jgi:hypothetical protein
MVASPSVALSNDDYEAVLNTNIDVQAAGVQNIHSLILVMLDLYSMHYTLGRYSLSDHVLLDTKYIDVPAWDRMDNVVKLWIWGTISPDLQYITRQCSHMARDD